RHTTQGKMVIQPNMFLHPVLSFIDSNITLDMFYFFSLISPLFDRIFWTSKKFEGNTDKVEPWFGTPYSTKKISTSMIENWMASAPTDHLQLPAVPNMFLPTNLSLKDVQKKVKFPVLLRKSSYSKLWYKPDTMFSTPKAFVQLEFDLPDARNSSQSQVLKHIFVRLLNDYLNEYVYYAEVTGLYFYIENTFRGFEVTMFGYNHKLNILLRTVIDKIANFEVKPERFSIIKEMITKDIWNFQFRDRSELAEEYFLLILFKDLKWPWKERSEVLPRLKVEHLVEFIPIMFSRAFLECFIAGSFHPFILFLALFYLYFYIIFV
ncbi:hypothetical protein CCACVL1_18291, partial [Corchorus capsularis]